MSLASASDLLDALRTSQLVPPAQLDEVLQNVPAHDGTPQDLARQLVQRGVLTAYQAEQLMGGQGKDLVVGPYRVLELLGEGGMGQVFKALHPRLGRVVALKVIRQDRLAGEKEAIKRFQREARAAAQLSHPNIVIVYDADEAGDRHFIAMEYVEGSDLAHLTHEYGPLPVDRACDFIRQAALGLQHAYDCGMVHRDIKPSNLLVSLPRGSRSTSGVRRVLDLSSIGEGGSAEAAPPVAALNLVGAQVKILDMGLARIHQPDGETTSHSLTQEGTVMGTPDYIAPEQARDARSADIRADLYSLGCTFYFLLTGQPPFPEGTVIEKLLMHQLDEPKPVEELRPDVPAEVAAVVRKLMAKRPEDRYQMPSEVAQILASLPASSLESPLPLADASGRPRPPSTQVVQVQPRGAPETPSDTAEGGEERTAASYYNWATAQEAGIPGDALPAKRIARFRGHRGWVTALAFSPDRSLLVSGGVDGTLRLWTFSKSNPRDVVFPSAHRGEINSVAFHPDSHRVASGSGTLDGLVWLWRLKGGQPVEKVGLAGHTAPVEALTFSPDGQLLATAGCDRTVRIWELLDPQPRERAVLKGHTDYVKALAFSPDGRVLASGSQDGTVRLWAAGKLWWAQQAVIPGQGGHVRSVAFAPDGQALAFGCMDQSVRLWDIAGPEPKQRTVLRGHVGVVRLVVSPPHGQGLLSAGDRGSVILWDVVAASRQRTWALPSNMICSLAATFDGRYLATGGSDGTAVIYRLYPKKNE